MKKNISKINSEEYPDLESELTEQEKKDRNNNTKNFKFIDWNKIPLDNIVQYLEEKYKFNSSGEAHAIFRLIEFYKQNK